MIERIGVSGESGDGSRQERGKMEGAMIRFEAVGCGATAF